jgi:GNAT superfamily N-acetyltransferase
VGGFTSGAPELDDWLRRIALNSDAAGNTRTWVWAPDGEIVVAYYTLCPTLVRRQDLPPKMARGALSQTPSILLARLALIEPLQGHGLGSTLLSDALTRALNAIEVVGGRFIVVDSIDARAASFYEHHGFLASSNNRERLLISANRVKASN